MIFGLFKKTCEICSKETKERLYIDGRKVRYLCRPHLIEEFRKSLLGSSYKMIIFHPELEKVCSSLYSYYPLDQMKRFNFSKSEIKTVEKLLNSIAGNCRRCEKEAQILYFPYNIIQYRGISPLIAEVASERGEPLCLEHVLEKAQPTLQLNKGIFDEGLYLPYQGQGMYLSTYL